MNHSTFSWDVFNATPIVAILRGQPLATCIRIAETLQSAGYGTLEVTMNTPGVAGIISELSARFPDLNVGAGTVCTPEDLEVALGAGASFIVTPIIDEEVITTCVKRGIPVFPGGYTPTEIYRAWSLGASAVKVFPASQLGVKYIKDLGGPLPQIKLVPTGGVSLENIGSFFAAGVAGVGMGSSLLDKKLIAAEDYAGLRAHFLAMKKEMESAAR
ncbi:bifunctional 4-hydroxy-2-oxoglutarate aldolase/2-dehydro-3-deoxy-phosphogluconate aldolase [Neolewinella aurantiaca]|uniref:Bifunctional 4-hydroxy-2-oxoglutarate aldolase/2-dehydro-3-deoxy-phosphogluconate aldolase n=1 Tax=Neolewinella aurantiaca TaxID=2602767 RepID=A0A5C7FAW0_9BACT|nr:bifunctional 4-hydroxy-2-oxoglutarate aldolase/2-dehydro-3-deoxy-phosphogluconate aldolase [Neolewinella aurantiaca]TXF87974.1 bifunctional 4-hydroxy-2-oxoglutarate aldolase/2-dehydro-3-deoxy-phosphogluconate aldolase [Neolewinella aurantiaca]